MRTCRCTGLICLATLTIVGCSDLSPTRVKDYTLPEYNLTPPGDSSTTGGGSLPTSYGEYVTATLAGGGEPLREILRPEHVEGRPHSVGGVRQVRAVDVEVRQHERARIVMRPPRWSGCHRQMGAALSFDSDNNSRASWIMHRRLHAMVPCCRERFATRL